MRSWVIPIGGVVVVVVGIALAVAGGALDHRFETNGERIYFTGRNEEELAKSREVTRRRISFYASTRSYSKVMSTHGWDDEAALLHRLSLEGKWDDMVGIVTDDMIEEFAVVGTWDELPAKMREKYAGINTQISFSPGEPENPDEEAQIREIINELKTIPTVGEAAPTPVA